MISDEDRQRALAIMSRFSRQASQIKSDPDLTDAAKTRRIAETRLSYEAQLKQLREAAGQRTDTAVREAHNRVFGMRRGASAQERISARDAADRAARVSSPAEARDLIGRAERSGDAELAAAVAARCHELAIAGALAGSLKGDQWGELAQQWAGHHGKSADLELLIADQAERTDSRAKLANALLFKLPASLELGGMTPQQILAQPPEDDSG